MTENSYISQFIEKYGENWRTEFEKQYPDIIISDTHLKRDPNNPYLLFHYGINARWYDPLVREARGIILDVKKNKVVCWPFNKFFDYNDHYATPIDWAGDITVYDKIDGSMISCWYSEYDKRWVFSTSEMVYASDARASMYSSLSFFDLVISSITPISLDLMQSNLNKGRTYIFEIVHPESCVVIKYSEPKLYFLSAKDNTSGKEVNDMIAYHVSNGEVYLPGTNVLSNVEPEERFIKILELINNLNKDTNNKYKEISYEGFVVVDQNFNRVKIKSPLYKMIAHMLNFDDMKNVGRLLQAIFDNELDIRLICDYNPKYSHILKYFDYTVEEFKYNANCIIDVARNIYNKTGGNRAAVGSCLVENFKDYKPIIFMCIGNDLTLEEILNDMSKSDRYEKGKYLCKFYNKYSPINTGLTRSLKKAYEIIKNKGDN